MIETSLSDNISQSLKGLFVSAKRRLIIINLFFFCIQFFFFAKEKEQKLKPSNRWIVIS